MRSFTITVGAPGSGKSKWAEAHTTPDVLNIERDRFRVALFGSQRDYWNQTEVYGGSLDRRRQLSYLVGSSMYSAMGASLKNGIHNHFIMSDTGAKWDSVKRFHALAVNTGCKINVAYFEVPWSTIRLRNIERKGTDKEAPEEFLRETFDMVNAPDGWWNDPKLVDNIARFDHLGRRLPHD